MVFPLFVIALLWDRFDWGDSRLLKGKRFSFPAFGRRLVLHSTALASGLILIAMGVVVVVIAFRGSSMPSSGWQLTLSADVQHYAHVLDVWLGTFPGWATGICIFAALAGLAGRAVGQLRRKSTLRTEEITVER